MNIINSFPGYEYIDGKNMGNTPQIITNLDVGNHQLELKKSQYVSIHKTINMYIVKTEITVFGCMLK